MKRWSILLAISFAPAHAQQPVIYFRGVANAASFAPSGLPHGAIARGGIFSVFGKDIGPASPAQVSAFPLQDTFGGVSIRVTQGANSVQAIPIFVSSTQINAIMPSNAPLGKALLRVSVGGRESGPATVTVADHALGIFTATGAGAGPAIVQNYISPAEQPLNTTAKTARQGQVAILWLTGLAPIAAPDNEAPPVGDLPVAVEIYVGGKRVTTKLYSGRSPCCSGVDQIVFEVPVDAPSGCYVPVLVKAGARVSNVVTMAIHPEGAPCVDTDNPFLPSFLSGKRVGAVELTRGSFYFDHGVFQVSRFAFEIASAYFRRERGGELAFNPNFSLPPAGTCTAYSTSGFLPGGVPFRLGSPFRGLDAGTMTLSGGGGNRNLPAVKIGRGYNYSAVALGPQRPISGNTEPPIYLAPGALQISSAGGSDLAAVQANPSLETPSSWTNRDQMSSIDRTQGVRFDWSATAKGRVGVGAMAYDLPTNSSAMFFCIAPAGATSFQVPPEMLANFPAARPLRHQSVGLLVFGSLPAGTPSPFTAAGLDFAAVIQKALTFKSVRFR